MTSVEFIISNMQNPKWEYTPLSEREKIIDHAKEMHSTEQIAILEDIICRLEEDGLYALQGIKHTLERLKEKCS